MARPLYVAGKHSSKDIALLSDVIGFQPRGVRRQAFNLVALFQLLR